MLNDIFVTKIGMTQAWTAAGKRVPVTRCRADKNSVVTVKSPKNVSDDAQQTMIVELGFGAKKHKNMHKPLRAQLTKSGFSHGVTQIRGVHVAADEAPEVGTTLTGLDVLSVGDVVTVRGISKGKGFAGAMKRHGFAGGPKTHGQSDRARAVGSIGAGTTPGRVWKGKKMPGRMGVNQKAIKNLIILHIDKQTGEIWLSGPVPGPLNSVLHITKTGTTKSVELHPEASGITVATEEPQTEEPQAKVEEAAATNE